MPQTDSPPFQLKNIILPTLILAIPILAFFGWQYYQIQNPEPPDYIKSLTGYLKRQPPIDKLNDKYIDADGDLVADGPKNPAERINPAELVFCPGSISGNESEANWRGFMDFLGKATGKKVNWASIETQKDLLDGLADGKIHVTSFSTGSVPTAVNQVGFVPSVALADAAGEAAYCMEIIVPAKSDAKKPDDLRGKNVALTSNGSHSGYKAPIIVLIDEFKMRPGTDFKFIATGGHAASIMLLGQGQVDAAAVAADVLADAVAAGKQLKPDQYRTVYKSKAFPKGAWGYTCLLTPELAAKVKEAYLTYPFAGSKLEEMFKGSKAVKFAPVDYKKDWAYVRDIDAKMQGLK